jgi:hypothetical protein
MAKQTQNNPSTETPCDAYEKKSITLVAARISNRSNLTGAEKAGEINCTNNMS